MGLVERLPADTGLVDLASRLAKVRATHPDAEALVDEETEEYLLVTPDRQEGPR